MPQPGAAYAAGVRVGRGCWFAPRIQRRQCCGDVDAASPLRRGGPHLRGWPDGRQEGAAKGLSRRIGAAGNSACGSVLAWYGRVVGSARG